MTRCGPRTTGFAAKFAVGSTRRNSNPTTNRAVGVLQRTLSSFSSDASNNNIKWENKKEKLDGHHQRPIFVAATRQHVGKTSVSLALMSGLKKRFGKVGFIKPGE
jgi:hypothetical protein